MLPLFQQEMKWEFLHTIRILIISVTFLEVACARVPITANELLARTSSRQCGNNGFGDDILVSTCLAPL